MTALQPVGAVTSTAKPLRRLARSSWRSTQECTILAAFARTVLPCVGGAIGMGSCWRQRASDLYRLTPAKTTLPGYRKMERLLAGVGEVLVSVPLFRVALTSVHPSEPRTRSPHPLPKVSGSNLLGRVLPTAGSGWTGLQRAGPSTNPGWSSRQQANGSQPSAHHPVMLAVCGMMVR